jgi:uncharacterized protein
MTPATLITALCLSATPAPVSTVPTPADLKTVTQVWHAQRIQKLTAEDGWLTLIGLHWLEAGESTVGSKKDNTIVVAEELPERIGVFTKTRHEVHFKAAPSVKVLKNKKPFTEGVIVSDAAGNPDVLSVGRFLVYLVQRGDRLGLRIKDPQSRARKAFNGIPTYPVTVGWRLEGKLEPSDKVKMLSVPDLTGDVKEQATPGPVVFTYEGRKYRLYPVAEPGDKTLFFIFSDTTNKKDTYGAGRFLYAQLEKDGRVVLDFNRAVNPPCAFSPYATCPLPPRENKLSFAVEAGEKRYGNH